MPIQFQLGVDAAVVLKYGSVDQSVIKGLNKLGLPSLIRSAIKVSQFREDFDISFTGGGEYGTVTFSGNMVLGDTKGQDQLKAYLIANGKITDVRFYLDLENFMTCDLANDENACFQVSKFTPGASDKNGIFTVDCEMLVGGRVAYFTEHMTADTLAFVATGNKITDSASGFVTAGFAAGQTLIVEGTTSNDGQYLITTVAAGELTLSATAGSGAVTDEAAGTDFTLHGGRL